MIYIEDNFLDDELIKAMDKDDKCFEKVDYPGKSFWVKRPTKELLDKIQKTIEYIEGKKITPILGFMREAKEGQDTDWRIHNDSIIEGQQPDRAAVLYVSEDNYDGINGTAFWEHKVHGDTFDNLDVEEYDRLITHDANNTDLWTLKTVVGHKQNRLVSYPCNYFHSKYPNEFIESRKVFVIFYKTDNGK